MPHSILPACVKTALIMQGVDAGHSRMPMSAPDDLQTQQIRKAMEALAELIEPMSLV